MIGFRFRFNSVFTRVMAFNILLVLIVTVIPQAFYINYFRSIFDEEINKYNMQRVKLVKHTIDGLVLEQVVNLPNMYFYNLERDDDLVYGMDNDIQGDALRIVSISTKLNNIRLTQNFIDSIYVYYIKSGMVITDRASYLGNEDKYFNRDEIRVFDLIKNSGKETLWVPTRNLNGDENYKVATYLCKVTSFSSSD